jgi:PAS domain S-box-containing protein
METRQPGRRPQSDQFRLLVDSVKDYAIFLLSPDGLVMSWNAGAERIKGYAADEIIGRHFSTFYPAADAKRGKPDDELRVAAAEGRYEEEGWRVRKDGSLFWASVVITALRDEQRELVGYAKVTRDLTERKLAEDQFRLIQSVTEAGLSHLDLEELLAALLDTIVDKLGVDTAAVLLMSDDESVLVARAARGIEPEVERGIRIPVGRGFAGRIAQERRPIVLDDVPHSDVLNPILREKGVRSLLGVPLLADGRVLGVLHIGSLSPARFTQRDVDGLVIVADRVAQAIDRAQLFETARAAKHEAARAEEAVRIREEFLSVAAHELKTPVTAAKVATQLLKRMFEAGALSEPQTQALESVDTQITRLTRLVGQLLDTVRIASGTLALDLDEVDLAELVRSVVTAIAPVAPQHRFVVDAPQHLTALLDGARIERVLTNLLDNAVKFSPEGGAIEVRLEKMDSTALLTVRDHGLGVAPEHRVRLFDRFYQAHPNRSGLGLGLHISRDIVERHGGTIYLDPPPDGGSRFVISLPLVAGTAVLRTLPQEERSRTV